jgi:putative ABC transport system permease protein
MGFERFVYAMKMRVRALFRRDVVDRELDDELAYHVEMKTRENIARGMSAAEARRMALIEAGGIDQAKEMCRDTRGIRWLQDLGQDLRFGLRMLRKNQGFTAVAVLTLALGIGANTAIFSVVNAVLLRPLAMQDPARVVYVEEHWKGAASNVSAGNFADLRRQATSFASFCATNDAAFNVATSASSPERVEGELATADCFPTFGVQPIAGRVFTAQEDMPGRGQVAVIGERLWRAQFHGDRSVVGESVAINGAPYTVIGIMPKTFDPFLNGAAIWVPEAFGAPKLANHDEHYLDVVARLKPGAPLSQAQSELGAIASGLQRQYPIDDEGRDLRAVLLTEVLLGDQRTSLKLLLAAVGFLLLIACANVANLQLARSRMRQKEIALRAALGASPQRIVRQLVVENIVLGAVGGIAGVLVAFAGVWCIVAYGPSRVPRLAETNIDLQTLAFACAVTLISSLAFGLAPALLSASTKLNDAFKQGDTRLAGGRDRIRNILVAGEVALAIMLMAAAGLLVRSALLVSHISPGFDASNLISGRVGLSNAAYRDPTVARQTFERLITTAAALPGVSSAATVSRAPLAGGGTSNGLIAEGKPLAGASIVNAQLQIVSPAYLSTARIPLKAGRDFDSEDTRDKVLVAIVNETLARRMWPGDNAIGKRFACCEFGPKGQTDPVWHEVVGVVGDVHFRGLNTQFAPMFYIPMAQMPSTAWDWIGRTMDLVIRTQGRTIPVSELRTAVASVAPGVPIYQVSTMQQKISGTLDQSYFETFLLAIFAAGALLLSSVGIYGVLSYTVAQRTRDIGIRMALGATRTRVMRDVLGFGMRVTVIGLAIGLAGAMAGTRALSSLLYGVHPTDAITYVVVSSILIAVSLLASYVPARRAMRVDPMVALRHE